MFVQAPERNLPPLAEWKLLDGHRLVRQDLRAIWLGRYAAELVDRLLEEHDPHPRLFDGLLRLLDRLADATVREAVFLAFQLNLLRQTGVLPDFSKCVGGLSIGRVLDEKRPIGFDVQAARLVCDEEAERHEPVPPEAMQAILALLRLPRTGGDLPRLSRREADPVNRLLARHLRHQTGSPLRTARYVVDEPDS